MAQEHLPSKQKALGSITSTAKKPFRLWALRIKKVLD
jgi:hypothetical protein